MLVALVSCNASWHVLRYLQIYPHIFASFLLDFCVIVVYASRLPMPKRCNLLSCQKFHILLSVLRSSLTSNAGLPNVGQKEPTSIIIRYCKWGWQVTNWLRNMCVCSRIEVRVRDFFPQVLRFDCRRATCLPVLDKSVISGWLRKSR